jgi:hypothetical protein
MIRIIIYSLKSLTTTYNMNTQQRRPDEKQSETKKQDLQNFSAQSGTKKPESGFGESQEEDFNLDEYYKDKNNFVDKVSEDSFPASDPPSTY